jgi:tetratricopeptide (TPR) repeat protein
MENHENHSRDEPAADDAVYLAEVAEPGPAAPQPARSRWKNVATILVVVSLVLGPVVYLGLPDEVSRWYIAAALEAYEDENVADALRYMDAASRWAPENPAIHIYGGSWKQREADYEGSLAEYNKALELDEANELALIQRSEVLQHLRQHDQAIADWKKLASSSAMSRVQSRVVYLNGLAYAQALGNTELDAALENIESAIRGAGQNAAMLDTRGYIQYRRGDLKSARADLELAVKMVENDYSKLAEGEQFLPPGDFRTSLKEYERSVAVIRYHRALVYEALGKAEAAEKDLARVRELGFEPGEHLF